jgi:hypothetical protein
MKNNKRFAGYKILLERSVFDNIPKKIEHKLKAFELSIVIKASDKPINSKATIREHCPQKIDSN